MNKEDIKKSVITILAEMQKSNNEGEIENYKQELVLFLKSYGQINPIKQQDVNRLISEGSDVDTFSNLCKSKAFGAVIDENYIQMTMSLILHPFQFPN